MGSAEAAALGEPAGLQLSAALKLEALLAEGVPLRVAEDEELWVPAVVKKGDPLDLPEEVAETEAEGNTEAEGSKEAAEEAEPEPEARADAEVRADADSSAEEEKEIEEEEEAGADAVPLQLPAAEEEREGDPEKEGGAEEVADMVREADKLCSVQNAAMLILLLLLMGSVPAPPMSQLATPLVMRLEGVRKVMLA